MTNKPGTVKVSKTLLKLITGLTVLGLAGRTARALDERGSHILFKVNGIMNGAEQSSAHSKICFIRVLFKNKGNEEITIPYCFATVVPRRNTEPLLLKKASAMPDGHPNCIQFAEVFFTWTSLNGSATYAYPAYIFYRPDMLQPDQQVYVDIAVPKPLRGGYRLTVKFDNRILHNTFGNLNSVFNPAFFEASDSVAVTIE